MRQRVFLVLVLACCGLGIWLAIRPMERGEDSGAFDQGAKVGSNEPSQQPPQAAVMEPAVLDSASETERAPVETETASENEARTWLSGELVWPPDVPADEHVEIVLRAFSDDEDESERRVGSSGVVWKEQARVVPGPDGRFQLHFPAEGTYRRVVLDARYLYLDDPIEIEDPAKPLVLAPKVGGGLRFHLVPPQGSKLDARELVGRSLWLSGYPVEGPFAGSPQQVELEVDARLELFAGGLSSEQEYELEGQALPFAQIVMEMERVTSGLVRDVEVELTEGLDLTGRVVDEAGTPVQGARVEAQCTLEHKSGGSSWWVSADVETTADGRFEFQAVHPALDQLEVSLEGCLTTKVARGELGTGGALQAIEIVLSRGETISVVVHLADGRGVQGAEVRCTPTARDKDHSSTAVNEKTDAMGRAVLSGLEPGEHELVVEARLASDIETSTAAPVTTVPRREEARVWCASRSQVGTGETIELVLAPPAGISGTVVDRDGTPLTSFRISAAKERDELEGFQHFAADEFFSPDASEDFESSDGRFVWDLPVGRWRVAASAGGFLDCRSVAVELPGQVEPLHFELDRAASIAGMVLDPDGNPVDGARITTVWLTARGRSAHSFGERTGATGAFHSRDLEPGRIELIAKADGFAPNEPEVVEVAPGEARSDVVLRLQRGGRLEVHVIEESAPAPGIEIYVQRTERRGSEDRAGSTDVQGVLTSELLAPGEYLVTARPEGRPPLHGRVALANGGTATITLGGEVPAALKIRGHVTSGSAPIGDASLLVYETRSGGVLGVASTQPDGSYELALPSGGPVLFVVLGSESSRRLFFHRELPSSGEQELDFDLPTCEIRGHIRRADGEPLGFWTEVVVLEDEAEGMAWAAEEIARTRASEDGSWSCSNLAPGTYAVQASFHVQFDRDLPVPARHDGIVLHEGELVEGVDLVLDSGGVIEGSVRQSDGRLAAEARVIARDESGRLVHPSGYGVGGGGRFRAAGLPAGRIYLEAADESGATVQPLACDVHAGETAALDLTLGPATILEVRLERAPDDLDGARLRLRDERGWEYGYRRAMREADSRTENGSRRFGPLHPGRWTLVLTLASGKRSTQSFDLTGEPERTIVLDLGAH